VVTESKLVSTFEKHLMEKDVIASLYMYECILYHMYLVIVYIEI
jgi:hypothetical protein